MSDILNQGKERALVNRSFASRATDVPEYNRAQDELERVLPHSARPRKVLAGSDFPHPEGLADPPIVFGGSIGPAFPRSSPDYV
jgi:hypothetical protein